MVNQELFNYMLNEHNVTLLESDEAEIMNIVITKDLVRKIYSDARSIFDKNPERVEYHFNRYWNNFKNLKNT